MMMRGFIAGFGAALCACALFRAPPPGTITYPGADRHGYPDGSFERTPGENLLDTASRQDADAAFLARQRRWVAQDRINALAAVPELPDTDVWVFKSDSLGLEPGHYVICIDDFKLYQTETAK